MRPLIYNCGFPNVNAPVAPINRLLPALMLVLFVADLTDTPLIYIFTDVPLRVTAKCVHIFGVHTLPKDVKTTVLPM